MKNKPLKKFFIRDKKGESRFFIRDKKGESRFFIRDKKGTEKLLSAWWFFVLIVITGGIVAGVYIYYFAEINVKEVGADILGEKIVDCLIDNGYLNEKVFEDSFDIFDECRLNKKAFEKGSEFYFKVSIYDREGLEKIEPIFAGDSSFEKDCKIQENVKAKYFPKCREKKEIASTKDGILKVVVLSASNQEGKKYI